MEINQNKNELHLYPINDNEYIGAINVDDGTAVAEQRTVFVLDSSESMGDETARYVKEIFPLVMSKLNYSEYDTIDLICFGKECIHKEVWTKSFVRKCSDLRSQGSTILGPAIEKLCTILEKVQRYYPDKPVRVLTISDGAVNDLANAEKETKKLIDFLATSELTINSQAVRLLTSDKHQPDTKALSYLLQINNTIATNLCDIRATESNENIANAIVALFQSDRFQNNQILEFDKSIVLKWPWNSERSKRIVLLPGWNIFWLKLPTGAVKLGTDPIRVIIEDQLNPAAFHQLMETKLAYIADHMTILKVVGTAEADESVHKIFKYFKKTENVLAEKHSTTNTKIITNLLHGIAKNKVIFSESAQMAGFIRKTNNEIEKEREKLREALQRRTVEVQQEAAEEQRRRKHTENEELRKIEAEQEAALRKKEAEEEEKKRMEHERKKRLEREGNELLEREEEEKKLQKRKLEEKEREERLQLQKKLEAGELFHRKERETYELQKKLEMEPSSGLQHINEKQDPIKKFTFPEKRMVMENVQDVSIKSPRKSKNSLIATAANKVKQFAGAIRHNRENVLGPDPIQTVFILDENVSAAKKTWRFTEKIIPLVFSKISYEKSQFIHLITVVGEKSPVLQMLQSILQTLDATKRVRILVLSNEDVKEDDEMENFAETLIQFISRTNFTFEFQVVRLASECQDSVLGINDSTIKYQLFDIDAKKSNAFIATRVVELFDSQNFKVFEVEQERRLQCETTSVPLSASIVPEYCATGVHVNRSEDLPILKCEFCTGTNRKYHFGYYAIFLIIFAIPILLLLFDIFICFYKKK